MGKVSVIIPVYNRSALLARAIGSVIEQSYGDYEVIVVDDASDDWEQAVIVINEFADERINLIRHKQNRGGGAARNTGVLAASGEYIAFLDSDDEWLPNKLQRQVEFAKNLAGDEWLAYCQSSVETVQGAKVCTSVMPEKSIGEDERVGDYLFCGRGWLQTSAFFLPKAQAMRVLFNEALPRHQDYDFLLRLESVGCRFHMLRESLVVVHWEDLHESGRGLNPSRSVSFLEAYKHYLSGRAQSGFIYQQVVTRLLHSGRRREAFRFGCRYVRLRHLSLVRLVSLLSLVIFRDLRLVKLAALVKKTLRG